eukprot:1318739-Rhodomonas_salina.1
MDDQCAKSSGRTWHLPDYPLRELHNLDPEGDAVGIMSIGVVRAGLTCFRVQCVYSGMQHGNEGVEAVHSVPLAHVLAFAVRCLVGIGGCGLCEVREVGQHLIVHCSDDVPLVALHGQEIALEEREYDEQLLSLIHISEPTRPRLI